MGLGSIAAKKIARFFSRNWHSFEQVIDKVLEGIVDAIFGFVLALVVLQFNSFNPWPILVSMSTLLVTFTFAVGPSAAKSIEVRPTRFFS